MTQSPDQSGLFLSPVLCPLAHAHQFYNLHNRVNQNIIKMKEKVLDYLKHDRSFDGGNAIYQAHGMNRHLKGILNVQGDFGINKEVMTKELAKEAGISESELELILATPVVPGPTEPLEDTPEANAEGNQNQSGKSQEPKASKAPKSPKAQPQAKSKKGK
jgi:hypothetical protein